MSKKIKIKKSVKVAILKVTLTMIILILDVILYHNLLILGDLAGVYSWSSAFIFVGWFWLLAGQFIVLELMWEI